MWYPDESLSQTQMLNSTIFRFALREATTWKRLFVVIVLAAIPTALFGIQVALDNDPKLIDTYSGFLISLVVPVVVLVLALPAFRNEVEDRTLSLLTTKPIPRSTIVLSKLAAVAAVAGVILLTTSAVLAIIRWEAVSTLIGALLGTAVATLAYATVFLWAGLSSTKGLIYSIVYLLLWENLLVAFIRGVRYTSISNLTVGISGELDKINLSHNIESQNLGVIPAVIGIAVFVVGFLLLAVRRLNRMDVP